MNYTIGLDIGIASIGWAVINNDKSRIEDLGVRVFKKAEEADGKALNLARREARGTRRRLRRRKIRMQKVKELLIEYQLVSNKELEELYVITNTTKEVWELRALALDTLLDRKELARILTNMAKRRGYQSNRKTDEEDVEVGRLSKGTIENKRILEQKGYRTIGEMFYRDEKFYYNKRNKAGEYNNTVLRSMLVEEIHILFEEQRKKGSQFASKEFEEEYINTITYQKDFLTPELLEKMLGTCTFEKDEHRAPKNSYTFERFMLLQKINHLKIDLNGEKMILSQQQREELANLAYEQAEIKYSQIRKKLNLPKEAKFVDLNYHIRKKKQEELLEQDIVKQVENTKFVRLEGWHKIRLALKANGSEEEFDKVRQNPQIQDIIADALVRNKTDETIRDYLQERKIEPQIIEAVLNINFTKFGHLSYKAMKKINPELEKGFTYDKACENIGYEFKGSKNDLQYKLPPVSNLENNVFNPVVLRAISQTRKVINAIIDKYGSPMAIYIETARELSKSYDQRKAIEAKQKDNYKDNEKIKEYIRENFHFEPKPFDLVKMKLWREQNGKCAYSLKAIPVERLYEENYVQVDHIIPFSRCFNDRYENKVLVLTDENQRKKERTPYEYFGEDKTRWHMFEEFVNITYQFNPQKKQNLLIKKLNEEKSKEWIQRNITDTQYIAKFMYQYITNNLKFASSNLKRTVYNINGQATAILRHYWGLKKDREESDKHHAQDAVIVACATNQNIKKVSDYSKNRVLYLNHERFDETTKEFVDVKYNEEITIKEPWPKFREEVEARMEDYDNHGELYALKHGQFRNYDDIDLSTIKPIFVSRMPERKITGRAHKDTMRSRKFLDKGYRFTVVKKTLKSITKQEIEEIIHNKEFEVLYASDKAMYDDIYEKMKQADFKAEKAFCDEYRKFSKKGNSPIVRSIKVPSIGNAGVRLRNGSIAENASMVRVDVFENKDKYYLVPIYVSDFVKEKLPNKAIVGNKDEKEWIEMGEEYKFKFSLYPNDLVKIKKKNEKEFFAYYTSTHRGTGNINTLAVNGEKKIEGIGIRNLEIFEKYQVDVLGNISKIRKEKREGV
ncbi:MAG: type II CRISPR RNA-guided endonuclease Cas9 [Clostridia bacterium]|nr:type II CRISPR RNA-guided endonuclease Cas9 [Clostridia bacterium]